MYLIHLYLHLPKILEDMEDQENTLVNSPKSSPATVLENVHDLARSCNRALETMRVELMMMTVEMNVPSPSLNIEQDINLSSEIEAFNNDLEKMKV